MHISIILHIWIWAAVVRNQRLSVVMLEKRDTNFPLSFPCYCHLLLVSVLSHSPFRHPSICPISPAMARFDLERREGAGVVGKALGIVFHWRGESIMPHGEENTVAFLLA